jgi:hypothetical protein
MERPQAAASGDIGRPDNRDCGNESAWLSRADCAIFLPIRGALSAKKLKAIRLSPTGRGGAFAAAGAGARGRTGRNG